MHFSNTEDIVGEGKSAFLELIEKFRECSLWQW